MNVKRLEILADFLEKLPPERFDYTRWVGTDWKGMPDLSCGARACALGWATTIPEFRELGLRLELLGSTVNVVLPSEDGSLCRNSFTSAALVFDIDSVEADYLFAPADDVDYVDHPGEDASPREVAQLIRDFIAAGGIPS